MTVKRGLYIAGAGVVIAALGFAIGSTQSNETGLINTIAAILGTAGAVVAVIGIVLTAVGVMRRGYQTPPEKRPTATRAAAPSWRSGTGEEATNAGREQRRR